MDFLDSLPWSCKDLDKKSGKAKAAHALSQRNYCFYSTLPFQYCVKKSEIQAFFDWTCNNRGQAELRKVDNLISFSKICSSKTRQKRMACRKLGNLCQKTRNCTLSHRISENSHTDSKTIFGVSPGYSEVLFFRNFKEDLKNVGTCYFHVWLF